MNSTSMSGAGATYAGLDAQHYLASGLSVYDVTFTVDQLTNFSMNGSFPHFFSNVSAILFAGGVEIFTASAFDVDVFSFSGQFDLTTTTVPVPGALWLFGSGLLALTGIARRRRAV